MPLLLHQNAGWALTPQPAVSPTPNARHSTPGHCGTTRALPTHPLSPLITPHSADPTWAALRMSSRTALGKDVLVIERFDRVAQGDHWRRRAVVSALTLFELDERMAAYASYETLAELIRHRFSAPKATLRELFSRMVFNILSGNTDDHARNHAAFWNGSQLSLTPAYDLCPQSRTGQQASQAMLIHGRTFAFPGRVESDG